MWLLSVVPGSVSSKSPVPGKDHFIGLSTSASAKSSNFKHLKLSCGTSVIFSCSLAGPAFHLLSPVEWSLILGQQLQPGVSSVRHSSSPHQCSGHQSPAQTWVQWWLWWLRWQHCQQQCWVWRVLLHLWILSRQHHSTQQLHPLKQRNTLPGETTIELFYTQIR